MEFVRGSIKNLNEIVRLNHEIFSGMYGEEPYSLKEYESRLESKDFVIFIAYSNEQMVGNSISFEKDGFYYLWILGVSKEFRWKGIGKKLLDLNEELARSLGYKRVKTKVYGVSSEMICLLKSRRHVIEDQELSAKGSKSDVYYFSLNLD